MQLTQYEYATRSKAQAPVAVGVVHSLPPAGFALVGKYKLMGQGVDKDAKIYQKEITLADGKTGTLLWWEYPLYQIDDFTYYGDRQQDINHCGRKKKEDGYTWHHTGWPIDEQNGTMQLVPTEEHSALGHVGGHRHIEGGTRAMMFGAIVPAIPPVILRNAPSARLGSNRPLRKSGSAGVN